MTGYNPKDAEGFINLFALPITVPQEPARPRQREFRRRLRLMTDPKNTKCGAAASSADPTRPSTNSSAPGSFDRRMLPTNSRSIARGRAPLQQPEC